MLSLRLSFLIAALTLGASSILAADKKCPSSAPCRSQFGYCGSSAMHCLSGCDPFGSYKHSSCAPMPRCEDQHLDFTNHQTHHVDISDYKGDPNQAPMTLEGGDVRATKTGLKLAVKKAKNDADGGTSLSTTRYLYFGRTTAVLKHANHQGIVAAFITMAPGKDEIDWEMTGNDHGNAQTNFYYHWVDEPSYGNGRTTSVADDFTTADWHSWTIDWSPTRIHFEIDGKIVRTVTKSSTKQKNGLYKYPATPSRIQLSIWDSDGMGSGTQQWTGGKPQWSKADSHGTFTSEIKSLDIQCSDPSSLGSDYSAYTWSSKMDPATGQPKVLGTKRSTIVN